jgi:hypothetical protein
VRAAGLDHTGKTGQPVTQDVRARAQFGLRPRGDGLQREARYLGHLGPCCRTGHETPSVTHHKL